MADFSLPVTVPDDKVDEFIDGLRWHYDNDAATPQQLRDLVAADVRQILKQRYKAWIKYKTTILAPPSDEIDII